MSFMVTTWMAETGNLLKAPFFPFYSFILEIRQVAGKLVLERRRHKTLQQEWAFIPMEDPVKVGPIIWD